MFDQIFDDLSNMSTKELQAVAALEYGIPNGDEYTHDELIRTLEWIEIENSFK